MLFVFYNIHTQREVRLLILIGNEGCITYNMYSLWNISIKEIKPAATKFTLNLLNASSVYAYINVHAIACISKRRQLQIRVWLGKPRNPGLVDSKLLRNFPETQNWIQSEFIRHVVMDLFYRPIQETSVNHL